MGFEIRGGEKPVTADTTPATCAEDKRTGRQAAEKTTDAARRIRERDRSATSTKTPSLKPARRPILDRAPVVAGGSRGDEFASVRSFAPCRRRSPCLRVARCADGRVESKQVTHGTSRPCCRKTHARRALTIGGRERRFFRSYGGTFLHRQHNLPDHRIAPRRTESFGGSTSSRGLSTPWTHPDDRMPAAGSGCQRRPMTAGCRTEPRGGLTCSGTVGSRSDRWS